MLNTDNKFGVFNKTTHILHQTLEPAKQFDNLEDAKKWFFTDQALAVHDSTCTQLEWELIENKKLKYTMAWGTKGTPGIKPEEDWTGQYDKQKLDLINSNSWAKNHYITERSKEHLF